jgi:hypothetical protein
MFPHPDLEILHTVIVFDRDWLRASAGTALTVCRIRVAALRRGEHERSRAQAANDEPSFAIGEDARKDQRVDWGWWGRHGRACGRDDDAGDWTSGSRVHDSAADDRRRGISLREYDTEEEGDHLISMVFFSPSAIVIFVADGINICK